MNDRNLVKVRTITAFFHFDASDFSVNDVLDNKIAEMMQKLQKVKQRLVDGGYEVQTIRLASNPFGEWMDIEDFSNQLKKLVECLERHQIQAFSVGPARNEREILVCPEIVTASPALYCSADLEPCDMDTARLIASCIGEISKHRLEGNFQFCMAANAAANIPFFPVAKAGEATGFALGMENGELLQHLLQDCASLKNISTVFHDRMANVLQNLQDLCIEGASDAGIDYLGIDSSINPSLSRNGSVALSIEQLDEIETFGGPGTVAAAAALTTSIQSLPSVKLVGYCGLMLPLCEDVRLAELTSQESPIRIADLLSISHVCGVGIDTVPIPGDFDIQNLASILLDIAAVAFRWNKSLSCRVFPVPSKDEGDDVTFDSPHMVDAKVLSLS